jgi:N6-adenosine-specific RNA methylase IME4/ParB-like chromosome segregation protein Spo0J
MPANHTSRPGGLEVRGVRSLRLHPRASVVPEMPPSEYQAFLADVRLRGLVDPLQVTPGGVVVDGRHRLRAARDLGLAEVPVRIVDPQDAVAYMIRAAVSRRQLSPSQRAALVVELDAYTQARRAGRARRGQNLRNAEPEPLPHRPDEAATLTQLAEDVAGVSDRTLRDAAYIHHHDPDLFAEVKAGRLAVQVAANRVRRRVRDAALSSPPLPRGVFDVVLADPPWPSQNPDSDWAPEKHYPTLPITEICTLQVPTAEDAVLFLWAVAAQLPDALRVIDAWGFTYRGQLVWTKPAPPGLGVWVRYRHEPLLVATRGSWPPPDPDRRVDSVITAPRRKHSQKPGVVHELIEVMYPQATRLELFARRARPGWTGCGNQLAQEDAA